LRAVSRTKKEKSNTGAVLSVYPKVVLMGATCLVQTLLCWHSTFLRFEEHRAKRSREMCDGPSNRECCPSGGMSDTSPVFTLAGNSRPGLWSTADGDRVCCSEAVGRSRSVSANGAGSPFASELCSVVYSGRVAMRAAVQPSITGMNPGGRRPTVPRTLVESDRSRRASAGAQVLYTVLGERERGCRMGDAGIKVAKKVSLCLRVVGGVLGRWRVSRGGQM